MRKVLLVIMDGAGYASVLSECGYLEGAVRLEQARRWKMHTALPSLSGPMYETIHTGLWPHEHGIVSNEGMRRSSSPNIFSEVRAAGKTTGAVAQEYFHGFTSIRPGTGCDRLNTKTRPPTSSTAGSIQWKDMVRSTRSLLRRLTSAPRQRC
ncbi:hypothetical protein IWQ48_000780 [Labrenzia sp. EL_13]|nr:hypothetical protein [Labrenzia sp. EL_13]